MHFVLWRANQQYQTSLWSKNLLVFFEYSQKWSDFSNCWHTGSWENLTPDDLYVCSPHAKITVSPDYWKKHKCYQCIKYWVYRIAHKNVPNSNDYGSRNTQVHNPNGISISSAGCAGLTAACLVYFTIGCPFSPKLPFPWETWSLDPIYSVVPWAHPSPQPKRHLHRPSHFLQGSRLWQTDQQSMLL